MPVQTPDFPTPAYQTMVEKVHKPVFLQKLARDWGVVPRNEVEEQTLLEMAGTLRRVEDEESVKQANEGTSLISEAGDRLKTALARRGYPQQPTSHERMIQKAAADVVATRPEIMEAALQFGDYVSQLEGAN